MRCTARAVLVLLALITVAAARSGTATDLVTFPLNIPAQDLATALLRYAAATHQQIAFDHNQVEGYRSTSVSGLYTLPAGLHALLGSAPFLTSTTASGVLTVIATPLIATAAELGGKSQSGPRSQPGSAPSLATEEVTVTAQSWAARQALRAKLLPKVMSFAYGVATQETELGLARWRNPVCPLVTGLSEPQGEFLLARISDIARAAGAPLAGAHCTPNLFVFVTSQPQDLLLAMEKRDYAIAFGRGPPSLVDEFIETPRAVRVWYANPLLFEAPTGRQASVILAGSGSREDVPGSMGRPVNDDPPSIDFWNVFVVVDQTRLRGVSLGQLADYIGMVGLAKVRPEAHLGEAQTILAVFTDRAHLAPAGMSNWDRAFLKALYSTNPQPYVQLRALLSLHMVREILP